MEDPWSPSVIWKEFDKEVKSFVFVLEGSSQTNKIQLPKENKQILGLIQRFLVLQIYIPLGQDFSTELLITDLGKIKRRLYLSTVHKELSSTPLHAKIPLFMIKRKIEYNWRCYQPSRMSESELQMLSSLRRQQHEELEDTGPAHGLSASQVDNCNVSISSSRDDTTTWNSCLPPEGQFQPTAESAGLQGQSQKGDDWAKSLHTAKPHL